MYILKVRQTRDVYFIADDSHEKLLKAADVVDYEYIGEKIVNTMVASVTPYTDAKLKEIESYVV
jgi:hypothetical protein